LKEQVPETVTIEKKQFDELVEKLNKISKLLALNLVNDCEKQKEKIIMLSSLGFGVTEIANLLNTSVGTANQALIRARKEKAKEEDTVPGNTEQEIIHNSRTTQVPESANNKPLDGVRT
jgi:DNA-directed RNA polymerase specialized sigma24 family protein